MDFFFFVTSIINVFTITFDQFETSLKNYFCTNPKFLNGSI